MQASQTFKATSSDGTKTTWFCDDVQFHKGSGNIGIIRDNELICVLGPLDYERGFEHINRDALS